MEKQLMATGKYAEHEIHICSYRTLTNEVTIKDLAEAFDHALRINTGIKPDEPFDAIVHSTGMLVLRSWLTAYGRHERVKHIIGLAPASFGSPLAHKGRSWIGSIFKGSRTWS
jgi:alpha-beta hydrolase superfamily lysophospholipase